jgi:hypothetical protein
MISLGFQDMSQRAGALAGSKEAPGSATVKDLVLESGFEFEATAEDRGQRKPLILEALRRERSAAAVS